MQARSTAPLLAFEFRPAQLPLSEPARPLYGVLLVERRRDSRVLLGFAPVDATPPFHGPVVIGEPLYEGPAHDATFYVPSTGAVRVGFSDPRASGYVCSRDVSLARVQPEARLF